MLMLPMLLKLALAMLASGAKAQEVINGNVPGMVNSGTPSKAIPAHYDCSVREHAWEFGKATLPSRGSFKTLYDALQLQHCNVSASPPQTMDVWKPPHYAAPSSGGIFVSPDAASGGDGSEGQGHAACHDTGANAPEQERRTAEMCSCTDSGIVVLDFFPGFTTIPAPVTSSSR